MPKRTPSNADLLVLLPWWVSATLALVVYIGLAIVLPNIAIEDVLGGAIRNGLVSLAPILTFGFLFLAGLSAFRARRSRKLVDEQTSLESLRALPWKRFEDLAGEVFRRQGYSVEESLGGGADGGVDLVLRRRRETTLVQCKQWKKPVGVQAVRELYGVMMADRASAAKLITTSTFTREATSFAAGKQIELITGSVLFGLIEDVTAGPEKTRGATRQAERDEDRKPTCPKCGEAMVLRQVQRGVNQGNKFWGCSTYPKCRGTVNASEASLATTRGPQQ